MAFANFRAELGDDGILIVHWEGTDEPANLVTAEVIAELAALAGRIRSDEDIVGAVLTAGKGRFSAGTDLAMSERLRALYDDGLALHGDRAKAVRALCEEVQEFGACLRRLETCGKPVVAAIAGPARGAGLEIALACHRRIAARDPAVRLALPDVDAGLIPSGGGSQRLARLIGARAALEMMLGGAPVDAETALARGLIDEIAPARSLLDRAKRWIAGGGTATQPWDEQDFRPPGGRPYSRRAMPEWMAANALYRARTWDNYPARRALMASVYEGLMVSLDAGLRIEARYLTRLLLRPEVGNMIRTGFRSRAALERPMRRPAGVAPAQLRTVGILGAGMMGSGIAHASAAAGLDVVLIDRDRKTAQKGKLHAEQLCARAVAAGRMSEAGARGLLARIEPTTRYGRLKTCDLVIEAVFEERALKEKVIARAETRTPPYAVIASNTSTLPISGLAGASEQPDRFIGIHFFSPVHRMRLVEIIRGRETGEEALAAALDYVRLLGKTPIVVNDARGFYASRVVAAYMDEGCRMLNDGVPAALIENAGRRAGMPVGPLALNDEVALDLVHRIFSAARSDLGDLHVETPRERILEEMVVRRGRFGRKNGKGFYDYPEDGRKRLWPGLAELFPPQPGSGGGTDVDELVRRLLDIQALEAVRCFAEGVVTDVREADVGAVLGWGFPPFTGGPLSYIDSMGADAFAERCRRFAGDHGEHFAPNRLLQEMAAAGESFYGRFAPGEDEAVR